MLMSLLVLSFSPVFASIELSGRLQNNEKQGIEKAHITLNNHTLQLHRFSDSQGRFSFKDLKAGEYHVKISHLGYQEFHKVLVLKHDTVIQVSLSPRSALLEEVLVLDSYEEFRKRRESRSVEIIDRDFLERNRSGSLMQTLNRVPGVQSIGLGSAQSKPLIRGLGFNRVVIAEHGIKHEAQQWGSDHALEIDQFAIDKMEIVKGPASLLFGSDAIGGVVDLRRNAVPAKGSVGGAADFTANSNNMLLGSSLMAYTRKNSVFFNVRITALDYADYRVPTEYVDIYSYKVPLHKNRLRNTAGNELNFHFSAGIIRNNWNSRLIVSRMQQKAGFFANAHGLEPISVDKTLYDKSDRDILYPRQEAEHIKIVNQSFVKFPFGIVSTEWAYQQNRRNEYSRYSPHGFMPNSFPEQLDSYEGLERRFVKDVFSGNIRTDRDNRLGSLTMGVSGEYQQNQIGGIAFIIPAYRQFSSGAFALQKFSISENLILDAGLRYDMAFLETESYRDWFPSQGIYLERAEALKREFNSITGAMGASYLSDDWTFKMHLGKGFRIPLAKELAANGINYHYFSYEKGDNKLSPEVSYQWDASVHKQNDAISWQISPFFSYFPNYIYLSPSHLHDFNYGAGKQIFQYTETEVMRWGGELSAQIHLSENQTVEIHGEYLYSLQASGDKAGFGLPFSPPHSALLGTTRSLSPKNTFFKRGFLSADIRVYAAQNRIVPPEKKTPGFYLIGLGVGISDLWGLENASISLQVNNLLNKKYMDHTGFYRIIGVPEAGRNVSLSLRIPFEITNFEGL